MAFSFIDPSNIKDFVHESDEYMQPHFKELAELERIGRGKPGRVPKGKPRITDGTAAGIRRETPKRIIQQLPTGKVTIKKLPELEPYVNAVLTDEILPHANSGGTPRSKGKKAIKDVMTSGASAALVFYNRIGDWFGADWRRIYIKDVGFEPGKVSEFDSNVMKITGWYTKMDIKALINTQGQLSKFDKTYKSDWDLKLLAKLLDESFAEKDWERMTAEERKKAGGIQGFTKIEHVYQRGTGAELYGYSPILDKVVKTCVNKDPRGIIPIHLLVPEEDDSTPIGEPLLSISAGKQNLLDFDMQMYQYSRGLLLSPPVKKWGNVPTSAIKLVPDAVIPMGGNKESGNDFEVVDFSNSAIADYRNNTSFIKTQIYNEQGATTDSSISASVGSVGYSKTAQGVEQQEVKLGISDNDLRKAYEEWQGRIYETLLNVHFAESQGKREIEAEVSTIKRLKLDPENMTMDYDQDFGKIQFKVDASTSEASDSNRENEQILSVLEVTQKYGQGLRPDRQMALINQYIQNTGVDDPENLQYTDEEIEDAKNMALEAEAMQQQQQELALEQQMNPPVDPMAEMQPEMPIEGEIVPQPGEEMAGSQNMPASTMNDDEVQTTQILAERGYSDEQIADAITMLRADLPDEEIMAVLGAPQGAV